MKPLHLTLSTLLFALGAPSPASAAEGARPHFVALSLGPTIGVSDLAKTQFDLTQSYNYHVFGTDDGLFVGVELQEGMGNYFRFSLGARAGWDWRPVAKLPLYVSPELRLGLSTIDGEARFNLRLGAEARYGLTERIYAILRPLAVNLSAGGDWGVTSIDILGGVGYAF